MLKRETIHNKVNERLTALDLQELKNNDIYKFSDYAFIYSYPPVQALRELTNEETSGVDFKGSQGINLYIHIPYCTGNCIYCYFSKIIDGPNPVVSKDEYITLLEKELSLYKYLSDLPEIKTIHIGGGTPSCLTESQITALFNMLRKNLRLSANLEITFECSPETILQKDGISKLKTLQSCGVNRINIGIESLDNEVLKIMKRRHMADKAVKSIEAVKESGCNNVNVDIMYGLPKQSVDSWYETLQILSAFKLESISTYRLRFHPQKEISGYADELLPTYEDSIRMYLISQTLLLELGYTQAASHKFAFKKDLVQKQILKKRGINENNVLGIGCSSYGFINNKFYWNQRNIIQYKQDLEQNRLPIWIGEFLDEEEEARKAIVLGLHLPDGINKKDFKDRFNISPEEKFNGELTKIMHIGLLENTDEYLHLNENGLVFADEICIKFYSERVKEILKHKSTRYGMFFDLADYNE